MKTRSRFSRVGNILLVLLVFVVVFPKLNSAGGAPILTSSSLTVGEITHMEALFNGSKCSNKVNPIEINGAIIAQFSDAVGISIYPVTFQNASIRVEINDQVIAGSVIRADVSSIQWQVASGSLMVSPYDKIEYFIDNAYIKQSDDQGFTTFLYQGGVETCIGFNSTLDPRPIGDLHSFIKRFVNGDQITPTIPPTIIPSPTPSIVASPTPRPTATITPTPTLLPTPTLTSTPTLIPTPTFIVTPTPNNSPIPTPSPTLGFANINATNITRNSATIVWQTNVPSTSRVKYGTSPTTLQTTTNEVLVCAMDHSVLLTNLRKGKRYFYVVESRDLQGVLHTSSVYDFTTNK